MIRRLVRWLRNTDHMEHLGEYIEKQEAIIVSQEERYNELKDVLRIERARYDRLTVAVNNLAIDLLRSEADLEYAKAVLYAIATDPHVNSRDDMIDLAFDTWLDLDGQ